jgi:hypothetical protein
LERSQLLIVDEVGYLPLERQAANLLFALVSRRYERGSIVITSNRGFEAWGEILGDAMVAAALIDRLVHHATMVTLKARATGSANAATHPPPRHHQRRSKTDPLQSDAPPVFAPLAYGSLRKRLRSTNPQQPSSSPRRGALFDS